ncbi:hypothetical protein JW835_06155 [bacterium]|nr:hypothetical protein [bacterium]
MKRILIILIVTGLLGTGVLLAQSEMKILHGDASEHKSGLHAGNQFRTTFYNDGTFGQIDYPPDIGGEWPINSGHLYLVDGNVFVGSEVIDLKGNKVHIVSTVQSANIQYSTGDTGPHGEWWTFLPLRGFSSPMYDKVAMSKWPWSWPASWPDKSDEPDDPGWRIDDEQNLADKNPNQAGWNGYFGRNQFNADEESFFYADDYANQEFSFHPDSTDTLRGGLGIRMKVRGFQWSNALVEDVLFCLFDLENIGTHDYDKVVFGYKIGNDLGNTFTGNDTGDDSGAYVKEKDVAYMYDDNGVGYGGWEPVGYFGAAFLESPGNHYDGIDNDGDGQDGPGVVITTDMFAETILESGQRVVKIDYITFERTFATISDEPLIVQYQDRTLEFAAGDTVREIPHNLIDDNLNGLIDESNGEAIGTGDDQTMTYLYTGLKSIDYLNDIGKDNLLIDERRDDGIDNDGDWNLITDDDVGQDGSKAPTPDKADTGEGDMKETPGEPHFDATDIDETDMLGLTSFTLYNWPTIPQYDDDIVWENIKPGFFDNLLQHTNVELLYGSGYFPMKTGQIQRFSMAFICGENLDDFDENTDWVATAYGENYKFSQAPKTPTVTAVAGDGYVKLMWDDAAEDTTDLTNKDPVTGWDFEGYRIYRSTDPSFSDMRSITDGKGIESTSPYFQWPMVQFDIENDYEGYAKVPLKGVHFWLGENLGLVHSYIDTTVTNGFTYYYAVVSYDHGSDSLLIAPTTCARFVSVNQDGSIDAGPNVVWVRPEAPVAGYRPANPGNIEKLEGSKTEGYISIEIMYPDSIQAGDKYRVTFQEAFEDSGAVLRYATTGFTLENTSTGDTLFDNSPDFHEDVELDITEGFRLHFHNVYDLAAENENKIGWSRAGIWPLDVDAGDSAVVADFDIIFFDTLGVDSSVALPEERNFDEVVKVNFKVWNKTDECYMKFAYRERDSAADSLAGYFTFATNPKGRLYSDEIWILSEDTLTQYEIKMVSQAVDTLQPQGGDTAFIRVNKPFLANDVFVFTMQNPSVDQEEAKNDLNDIRVVPNPYIVSNSWEPPNTYANGRGPRELHFINLPDQCTLRIFNIRGQLIRTLEHDSGTASGTVIWDMKSEEGLDIAYGIYIYHVDAGKVGNKISKFAVIK